MEKEHEKEFRVLLSELRERCPPVLPVKVRRKALKEAHGLSSLVRTKDGKPSYFLIEIEKTLCWVAVKLILIHEWAHCLCWIEGVNSLTDHNPIFGIFYSFVYGELVEP